MVYTGSTINSGIIAPSGTSIVTNGSTTSAINVGEYSVILQIDDTNNYEWSDKTTDNKTVTWRIVQNTGNIIVTLSSNSYTYDGNAKTPNVTVKQGTTTLVNNSDY